MYGATFTDAITVLNIKGILYINGRGIIGNGGIISIAETGILSLGADTELGPFVKIYTDERIDIGNNTHCSWECQLFDSDFHFMIDHERNIYKNCKPIIIGGSVWIGNRVTISKGVTIASRSIIASHCCPVKVPDDYYKV